MKKFNFDHNKYYAFKSKTNDSFFAIKREDYDRVNRDNYNLTKLTYFPDDLKINCYAFYSDNSDAYQLDENHTLEIFINEIEAVFLPFSK